MAEKSKGGLHTFPVMKEMDPDIVGKLADALNRECTFEMPPGLVDEFISFGTLLPLRRGERIISAGEVDDDLYIIESGIMRSWYHDGLGRYKALLSHRPEIIRNVPLKIIASYLGVTPEYLSNLRKKV